TFIVTNDRPDLFTVAPQVSPNGTLSFTLAPGAYGTANVRVVAKNDGGTNFGGVDSTGAQTMKVNVAPLAQVQTNFPGGGPFVWVQVDAPVQLKISGSTPDNTPATLRIVDGPSWLALDPRTGALSGTPRTGDPGLTTLVITATTPSGGVTTQTYLIGLYRPSDSAGAWLPWRPFNAGTGALDFGGRGPGFESNLGRRPVSLDSNAATRSRRRLRIKLPAPAAAVLVRVLSPGADGLLGTADDVEMSVRGVTLNDGLEVVIELADVPAAGAPLLVVIEAGGETYVVRVD
ncbi:MAG: putative Ig domain-containing protein, partial [Verrucomicrobia bacterium]|nr:putative Ig domain-containing protein [Verrucomicrobiota bacterium]